MRKILFVVIMVLASAIAIAQDDTHVTNQSIEQTGTLTVQTTVVELFTSQGCSSCPPADKLLAQVQEQYGDQVITLSYHVDYWDYIGWKDPFASRAYTLKQYSYAEAFNSRGVYTPQVVINGNSHFTGSDVRKMRTALKENRIKSTNSISLQHIKSTGNKIFVQYAIEQAKAHTLTFVLALKKRITKVSRGENSNRTLTNHNIVIDQVELTAMQQGNIQLTVPTWVEKNEQLVIVAYSSKKGVGITDAILVKI